MTSPQEIQTKKVAFDKLLIKGIPCDFSPEETQSYWWTNAEYAAMRRRDAKIHMLHEIGNPTGRKLSTDGLILDEPRLERKQRIRSAMLLVLMEQEVQWDLGVYDPDNLAVVSRDQNYVSKRFAHQRGLNIAQQVRALQVSEENKAMKEISSKKLAERKQASSAVEDSSPMISLEMIREASNKKSTIISPRSRKVAVGRRYQTNCVPGIRQL